MRSALGHDSSGVEQTIPNDVVFTMIGREAPLDFFRRSGIRINGEWTPWKFISFALFVLFCVLALNPRDGAVQNAQTRSARRRVCSAEVPGALLICSVRMKRRLKVIGSKTR